MHHGDHWEIEDVAGKNVFILDFSFARSALEAMAHHAISVCQIDHHASAREGWAAELSNITDSSMSMHQHPALPLKVIFDIEKSGARLAWEHFHPETTPPLALRHIEDQDLCVALR